MRLSDRYYRVKVVPQIKRLTKQAETLRFYYGKNVPTFWKNNEVLQNTIKDWVIIRDQEKAKRSRISLDEVQAMGCYEGVVI